MPEYWALNPNPDSLGGLPARSDLSLRAAGGRWAALDGADLVHAATTVIGLRPVLAGRVRSSALGRDVDVDAPWTTILPASRRQREREARALTVSAGRSASG